MKNLTETLQDILTISTILGGLSSIWFFWEKITPLYKSLISRDSKKEEEFDLLSLSDDEFSLFEKILKNSTADIFLPTSETEAYLCNSFVNKMLLIKLKDSSYKPTKKCKYLLDAIK